MSAAIEENVPRGYNPFRDAIVASVHRMLAAQSRGRMHYDEARGGWLGYCAPSTHIPPVPLQAGAVAADLTEHGVLVLPVGANNRHAFDVRFTSDVGALAPHEVVVRPGALDIFLHAGDSAVVRVTVTVDEEGVLWEPRLISGSLRTLHPLLVWTPESADDINRLPWLAMRNLPIAEDLATSSNSRLPDPLPPSDLPSRSFQIHVAGSDLRPIARVAVNGTLLAERPVPHGTVATGLPGWTLPALSDAHVRLRVDGPAGTVGARRPLPSFELPDPPIKRQVRFSTGTSLASAVRGHDGHVITVHGRRDRGFGDVAHLHQSHQVHLVALASGATEQVRDELLAFAAAQDSDGAIRRAPGVGAAHYPYVPGFTDEHLILGVHRYVAWTGDMAVLDTPVPSAGGERPLLACLVAAAESLLSRGSDGLLTPCGWADAWPPAVRAQAQVSMTGAEALEALAALLEAQAQEPGRFSTAAADLRRRVDEVFLDAASGLYAEHLFADGVAGGAPDDFWTHTQISAILSGQTNDRRGMDHLRHWCFRKGITGTRASTLDAPYVAESTDADAELELDSTATWMLATWPELTHRYALAEIRLGRPDRALSAVVAQLPESLHEANPFVAPWYYAEKYLYPGDEPWLFTWGGDPTLVEVVLCGFFGVAPTLGGLRIDPVLPAAWNGQPLSATFHWRGRWHVLHIDPSSPEPFHLRETES